MKSIFVMFPNLDMSSLNKQEDKARKMLEALNSTSVEWCFN